MTEYEPVKRVLGWNPGEGGTVLITARTPREFVEMVHNSGLDFVDVSELLLRRDDWSECMGRERKVS